jgi:DNA gyrase/topoisomerase IV subunit B
VLTVLVWGSRGSLGPAIANRHCETLQYWSRRDGEEWTQRFRRGRRLGPSQHVGDATDVGTTIEIVTKNLSMLQHSRPWSNRFASVW